MPGLCWGDIVWGDMGFEPVGVPPVFMAFIETDDLFSPLLAEPVREKFARSMFSLPTSFQVEGRALPPAPAMPALPAPAGPSNPPKSDRLPPPATGVG